LLTTEAVTVLRDRVDELMGRPDRASHGIERVTDSGDPNGVDVFVGVATNDRRVRDVLASTALRTWTAQLLRCSDVELVSDEVIVKAPRVGGEVGWHQDWFVKPDRPSRYITCWIPLDDVEPGNGAMQIIPGTHNLGPFLPREFRSGVVPDGRLLALEAAGMEPLPDPLSAALPLVELTMSKGDCSFHHCLTWHRSLPNRSSGPRRAIVQRYDRVS
jgi:hypothetical protein